jgi:hypothetical protein
VLLAKNVKLAVPVGTPKPPETVALSWTLVPADTVVTGAWFASWISVTIAGVN